MQRPSAKMQTHPCVQTPLGPLGGIPGSPQGTPERTASTAARHVGTLDTRTGPQACAYRPWTRSGPRPGALAASAAVRELAESTVRIEAPHGTGHLTRMGTRASQHETMLPHQGVVSPTRGPPSSRPRATFLQPPRAPGRPTRGGSCEGGRPRPPPGVSRQLTFAASTAAPRAKLGEPWATML